MGWGRGLWRWLEIFPEGVPPIGSPTDSPKAAKETQAKPMEEAGAASKINSPCESSMMADRNEMPPLEEEETIAELDAAIDEAGRKGRKNLSLWMRKTLKRQLTASKTTLRCIWHWG